MTRVGVGLLAGLILMALALGVTLTRAPPLVAGSDLTALDGPVLETSRSVRVCQPDETLPAGTSAIRLSLYTLFGPRISVEVRSGDRLLTSGTRTAGWIGESPTVAVRPVSSRVAPVEVCFAFGRIAGSVTLFGNHARAAEEIVGEGGRRLDGRIQIEYLKSGDRSWLSSALGVARRMGLGRWPAGTWVALLAIALMAMVLGGVSWLTMRELR